jgi:hypothetical protein
MISERQCGQYSDGDFGIFAGHICELPDLLDGLFFDFRTHLSGSEGSLPEDVVE